jgi:ABC-type uncharacterized transport system permease subunit
MASEDDPDRRRRVRRTAIILAAVALAFYVGFIVMSLVRASRGEHPPGAPHASQPLDDR